MFNIHKLLADVFEPVPTDTVAILSDVPTEKCADHIDWAERRSMAHEWREAFLPFQTTLLPLITYPATGAHNSDFPNYGHAEGRQVNISEILDSCSLAVAMTEYSATAPLAVRATPGSGGFRAASMPGVLRRMEKTALCADYKKVAMRAHHLANALSDADHATVVFSTGHELNMDLRFRSAHADDGQCTGREPRPLINLPSGEGYIVPYEGERPETKSETEGVIPVYDDDGSVEFMIERNRIQRVEGSRLAAKRWNQYFDADPARRNIAELGLGCNEKAAVSGNVLEDEKAGFHWAYGRSEHLGGTVGPDAFLSPETIVHRDIVYASQCPISIQLLRLHTNSAHTDIILNGDYVPFE